MKDSLVKSEVINKVLHLILNDQKNQNTLSEEMITLRKNYLEKGPGFVVVDNFWNPKYDRIGHGCPVRLLFQIQNMTSVMQNLFHQDNRLILFIGSRNTNLTEVEKVLNLSKDIIPKVIISNEKGIIHVKLNHHEK